MVLFDFGPISMTQTGFSSRAGNGPCHEIVLFVVISNG